MGLIEVLLFSFVILLEDVVLLDCQLVVMGVVELGLGFGVRVFDYVKFLRSLDLKCVFFLVVLIKVDTVILHNDVKLFLPLHNLNFIQLIV